MADRRSPVVFLGLFAVAFGVCCGFPILVSVGVVGAIAGLSLGSWTVIAVGVGIATVRLWRFARRGPRSEVPGLAGTSAGTGHDGAPHSDAVHQTNGTARDEFDR